MCKTVVFTFDRPGEASDARAALKGLERQGSLVLEDALVLVKDEQGQVRRSRDKSHAVLIGALIGAGVGLLFMFMFPIAGVLFGVGAGALLGKLLTNRKVDGEFVADAEAGLAPCTSALLLLMRQGNMTEVGSVLQPFPLHIYQTSLSPEQLAELARATQIAVSMEAQGAPQSAAATPETRVAAA